MPVYETYAKRKKAFARGSQPDVYQYNVNFPFAWVMPTGSMVRSARATF